MEKSISDEINEILKKAKYYQLNNNFAEATKLYEKILSIDSKNFETLFFLSIIKAQTKKFKEAKDLINRAIEIKPEMPDLYNNLGLVFWEMKKECYKNLLIHCLIILGNLALLRLIQIDP